MVSEQFIMLWTNWWDNNDLFFTGSTRSDWFS